jgi:hypothetical protein
MSTEQGLQTGDVGCARTYAGRFLAMDTAARLQSLRVVLALCTRRSLALLVHTCHKANIDGSGSEEFRRIGVAGWIDEPQSPEHGGDRLVRDLDHALTGIRHG